MGKIIAISNQKGGVGKSTTAINLSACLAELGKKVLVIDMDPQGNATSGLGVEKNEENYSVYDFILGECSFEECLETTAFENLEMIASNASLATAEIEMIGREDKEYSLSRRMDEVRDRYDYVIIDCPPSLSVLTLNALCAADGVIIPIQCEYYALEGLSQILKTVELVKERLNPNIRIEGIVFTMYDARTNLSADVVANVKENLDIDTFISIIPRNVRLAEAPSYGLPVIHYDSNSTGAIGYRRLAKEVLRKGGS